MDDAAGRENFKTVVICFLIQADEQIPSQVEIQLENLQLCKDRTDGPDRVIQQGDWNFTAPVKPSGAACTVEGQIPLTDATGTLYQLELSALGGSYVVDDGTLANPPISSCKMAAPSMSWSMAALRMKMSKPQF